MIIILENLTIMQLEEVKSLMIGKVMKEKLFMDQVQHVVYSHLLVFQFMLLQLQYLKLILKMKRIKLIKLFQDLEDTLHNSVNYLQMLLKVKLRLRIYSKKFLALKTQFKLITMQFKDRKALYNLVKK